MSLASQYKEQVIPELKESLGIKNTMAVPKITKITLNAGINPNKKDKAVLDTYEKVFERISGQKPVRTQARLSISNFKIREGQTVGMSVTLRGKRMWDFLEKLISITLPRVRDFRGISVKNVDRTGNFTLGFKEHLAFPEINADEVDTICGLQVCVSTTAKNYDEGFQLLDKLGIPFAKD